MNNNAKAVTARQQSSTPPLARSTVTLVTEAYNLAEGQSEAAFLRAVGEVQRIAAANGRVDVVVVDPSERNLAAAPLQQHYPQVQALHLPGRSYDGQKNAVSRASSSDFIVFLDGDCKPQSEDWLDQLLRPFVDPTVPAVGGLTLYEDFSITGKAMTVMDFGFLFEVPGATLGCYASNNVAFRRQTLLDLPMPESQVMRCTCYKHAQLLQRAGDGVRFHPDALVLHELPDVRKERLRRGYDHVTSLWDDPELYNAGLLEPTEAFVAYLMEQNTRFALDRLDKAPPELQVSADKGAIADEIRRLIQIDEEGIRTALEKGEANGLNRRTRDLHFAQAI
jgi:hypothetical protein